MPCAIGAFLQEASEFRHHSHQTSLDVCEMDGWPKVLAAEERTVLWKTVQFSSGSSELRFIASSWLQMSVKKSCLMLSLFSFETSSLLGAFLP